MKVLLIDADSTIPNLALMKLSAWHKVQGDEVSFSESKPDKIYASIIFKKNRLLLSGIQHLYPEAEIVIGGSGYDLKSQLLPEIEAVCPDYSLYPDMDYSLGFTSRGCPNHCYFCWVPEKEGKYKHWHHPSLWVRHNKAKLLDNNWYADPEWFFETSQWFIDHHVAVDVTQGMDIRLITPEIAQQLKRLMWWNPIHFAFDDDSSESKVLEGIEILKATGHNVRSDVMFLVYCHDNKDYLSALRRAEILKAYGTTAFIMWNMDNPHKSKRVKDLIHTVNRPWIYWSKGSLEALPHVA